MLLTITEFIGRFHPLLVHLPIGILLMALLFGLLARKEEYSMSHGIMKIMWSIGIISSLLSCLTGYLLSLGGDYDQQAVDVHMWLGIGVALVSVLIGIKVYQRRFDIIYKCSCLGLFLLIAGAGHFGGSLTHGDDYLTGALSSEEEAALWGSIKPLMDVQEAQVYNDVVQPILKTRCYSCHGKGKQKGKLRMDTPEYLMKGGKNGEVIIPGKTEESELMKRVLLPLEHDDHMSPKGKLQLTKSQVSLLKWWIEAGAPLDKKVKDLQQPEKIKGDLLLLQSPEEKEKLADNLLPMQPVEAAGAEDIERLREKGIVVLPVAQNSNYLMANFVTAPGIGDKDLQMLIPIKKQLIILKIGNSRIGDEGLRFIGQCSNIRQLQLNNTGITDKGLAGLNGLKDLHTLNLVGTKVTDTGLQALKNLSNLRTIYLFQTNIRKDQWSRLKAHFPKTHLDTGGYKVPTLVTDTTVMVLKKSDK